jgi:hypothetical protein
VSKSRIEGRPREEQYFWIAIALFVGAFSLAVALFGPWALSNRSAFLGTVLLGTVVAAVWFGRVTRTGDLLDPLAVVSAVIFFYFVLHAFWLLERRPQSLGILRRFDGTLARSQTLLLAAFVVLAIGFLASRGCGVPHPRRWATSLSAIPLEVLIPIFILGMTFNVLAARSGAYSRGALDPYHISANVLLWKSLGFLAFIAFFATLCKAEQPSRGDARASRRVAPLVMAPVQIGWSLVVGSKMDLVFVAFGWLVVRNYLRRPLTIRAVGVAVAIFVFVITPFVHIERSGAIASRSGGLQVVSQNAKGTWHALTTLARSPGAALDGFSLLQRRTNGSESLALAVGYGGRVERFQHGRSWRAIPLALIPRALWRSKPAVEVSRSFSLVFANQPQNSGYGLAVAPTIPGDLYINFGTWGVVLGFLLLGLILRIAMNRVRAPSPGEGDLLLYVVLLMPFLLIEQDVATVASSAVIHLAMVFAFLAVASVAFRQASSVANSGRAPLDHETGLASVTS